jgi:hypothetical protein
MTGTGITLRQQTKKKIGQKDASLLIRRHLKQINYYYIA